MLADGRTLARAGLPGLPWRLRWSRFLLRVLYVLAPAVHCFPKAQGGDVLWCHARGVDQPRCEPVRYRLASRRGGRRDPAPPLAEALDHVRELSDLLSLSPGTPDARGRPPANLRPRPRPAHPNLT